MRLFIACAFVAVSTNSAFTQESGTVVDDRWFFEPSVGGLYGARCCPNQSLMTPLSGVGTILAGLELPFSWAPGLEAGGTLSGSTWGIEARFLGGFSWDSSVDKPGVTSVKLGGVNILGVTNVYILKDD